MFDSTKQTLKTLLEQVRDGKLQLPDFQRGYVWNEDAVVSLLASIAKGYPVGALLTLERGGQVNFKFRPVEGTTVENANPEALLLDGQQRMTSLYQSAYSDRPAKVKNAQSDVVERYFYLNLRKALANGDFEDAIETVPATRIRMKVFAREVDIDVSTSSLEFEQHLFPLNRCFDEKDWVYGWRDHWKAKGVDIYEMDKAFDRQILDRIQRYEMPIIKLTKDNGREAVCTIFEKVNVGGVKLDAFELVTAIFAGTGEGFDLREDWWGTKSQHGRLGRIRANTKPDGVFAKLASTDFLQACTLLHTMEVRRQREENPIPGTQLPQITCKRDALLALPLSAYQGYADRVEVGFIEGGKFLAEQNIVYQRDLPYPPQLVALAALFASLPATSINNATVRANLSKWFWAGVLGEHYGGGTETKIARDVPQLIAWLEKNQAAPTIFEDVTFVSNKLTRLRRRQSAAYKGFHALLMREGCRDFVSGKAFDLMTLWSEAVDVHHIFPQSWCRNNSKALEQYDSIVNKTPLSAATNRYIVRGDAPSVYLKRIEQDHKISAPELDAILKTHLIPVEHLRADDFEAFFDARMTMLAGLAGKAMGKASVDAAAFEETTAPDDALLDEIETADAA
ncbi:DUF262 domain-containing protein [Mesorhizobium sp. 8]|uniref:DUF262 domain-containing protein n=1 Tax=Mesorhizobium sp. 8 TaxID=2584466 RepID=UPI0015D66B9F|nr:DUF262 domain-containing protein [Mesorhizobium sp. 8]